MFKPHYPYKKDVGNDKVCDRLINLRPLHTVVSFHTFSGMDAQSRLQTGAPNGGRFVRGGRMRERLCLGERLD